MDNANKPQSVWDQNYKISSGRPPREFLNRTLSRFQIAGLAIDLGCGAGVESIFLLQHGWQVFAIDQQESAVQKLRASSVTLNSVNHLETLVAPFETINLPSANLIWAGLSLPFCPPHEFETLWRKICSALLPGGRFAGDFFGPRHAWSSQRDMTFHTKEQILAPCTEFQLEYIVEEEGEQMKATNMIQHLHMFTVSALKP